jgi:DNA replication protein DnaC
LKRLEEILSKRAVATTSETTELPEAEEPSPSDDCAVCKGAGFVRRAREIDDPKFGRAEPCECVMQEDEDVRRDRLQRLSNLGALKRFTFESLDRLGVGGSDDNFAKAYDAVLAFSAEPEEWLVLSGASGTGKTHLAAAIANERIRRGEPVYFQTVSDLLDSLRASYQPDEEGLGFEQLFEQVRTYPLLILDDVDAVAPTDWAREKLLQIMNARFTASLPTVFTTATPVSQLEPRLATRLSDPALVTAYTLGAESRNAPYEQVGGMTLERLEEMQFHNFDLSPRSLEAEELESLDAAFRAANAFAAEPAGWLVLQGDNGCGKTHLAAAVANKALSQGRAVVFAVVADLLDHLRSAYAPNNDTGYDEVFDSVREAELLVMDDLGSQQSSPWAQEKLFQLVNYRALSKLPTVVTTDLSDGGLRERHPRIFARIADPATGNRVRILAPHYRLQDPSRRRRGR